MTTLDDMSIPTILAHKMIRRAEANTRTKQMRAQVLSPNPRVRMVIRFQALMKFILTVAGFGCLTFAGFAWSTPAGFVVAGISCLILSWLTTSQPPTTGPGPETMRG